MICIMFLFLCTTIGYEKKKRDCCGQSLFINIFKYLFVSNMTITT